MEFVMSQRELHRMHVVRLTLEGRESVRGGAKLLGISSRQMKRLRRKMTEQGMGGLKHGNWGKAPWNKRVSQEMEKVIRLARGRYQGLNDTHLTEKLKEKEAVQLSRSTIRRMMRKAGIKAVRRRAVKRHYKRRERRAQEGALVLWDGSPHRWLGEKLGEWTLMAVIDDATGALVCGVFALEEDAHSYLLCLRQMLLDKGIPGAIYMDRHGIFFRHKVFKMLLREKKISPQLVDKLLSWKNSGFSIHNRVKVQSHDSHERESLAQYGSEPNQH